MVSRRIAERRSGFTLTELLVVMGVIAVMAALIMPSLASAKRTAHRLQCVSQLHQLGLACQMYWDDHEGEAFRWRGESKAGGQTFWFGWLQDWNGSNEGQREYDAKDAVLYPYVQGRGLEACPSLVSWRDFKWKAAGATYGYGYNLHLSKPAAQPAYKLSRLVNPADTAVLGDAAQVNTFQSPASPDHPLLEEFYYLSDWEPTAHFRHGKMANILFADIHVEGETMAPGTLDNRLPSARVGRLRASMLLVP